MTDAEKLLMDRLAEKEGWYDCPKDSDGKRLGPLVGYAARYADKEGEDDVSLQYVGDTYVNCAVLEEDPRILHEIVFQGLGPLVKDLLENVLGFRKPLGLGKWAFCGAPEGGKSIASLLAMFFPGTRYIYPEKKVVKVADDTSREVTKLVWGRHQVRSCEDVVIVEDLLNNFSTTEEIKEITRAAGGKVMAIASLVNRSLKFDNWYMGDDNYALPIVTVLRKSIPQFKQSDPAVAEDIKKGNIVWKPKGEWYQLKEAIEKASNS
ncbi:MAG: hypothetical protein PHU42_03025 [Patescibacteria group bacterium]|nr:hypothetical protein [Patescibacteria group bacterium]